MTRSLRLLPFSLLAVGMCLVGVAGCGDTRSSPQLGKGEAGYLECRGEAPIYVSVDATTQEQVFIFLGANNTGAVQNLIARGAVITCEKGTRVTVVEPGGKASAIQITSGTHSGKAGFVVNECLRRFASR
jgi:hypothetical protein